jgi:hypothetical protein
VCRFWHFRSSFLERLCGLQAGMRMLHSRVRVIMRLMILLLCIPANLADIYFVNDLNVRLEDNTSCSPSPR